MRCLRTFFAQLDVELDGVVFFEGLISLGLNCGVVAEDVWSAFMLEETKTFCIVEPRNFACVLRHWKPDFLCSLYRTSIEQYETYGVCRSFVRGVRTRMGNVMTLFGERQKSRDTHGSVLQDAR